MCDREENSEPRPFNREGSQFIFDKPKSDEEIARETREREQHEFARGQVKTNRLIALFTGLLVVGTFVGTGISIWQARIAQKSADAAESAAATATNSLKLTKQIIESSEAAFIDWDVSVISFHAQSVSVVSRILAASRPGI